VVIAAVFFRIFPEDGCLLQATAMVGIKKASCGSRCQEQGYDQRQDMPELFHDDAGKNIKKLKSGMVLGWLFRNAPEKRMFFVFSVVR